MPTTQRSFKSLIYAKQEVSYGVDPTPATTDAIIASDMSIEPLTKKLVKNPFKAAYGALSHVPVGEGLKISFTVDLQLSGAAGTAPRIGRLLRACNMTETVTASVKVDYDPNSSLEGESVAVYFYKDGICHKALGMRGSFSLEAKAGERGKIKFELTGLYAGPVDSAPGTPDFGSEPTPPLFSSSSFALDSYAAIIETLKIDMKNEVVRRADANSASGIKEYFIKDRAVSGECDPEVVDLATKDWPSIWEAGTLVALTATVGSAAGNKCIITAPKVQIDDEPKYGERETVVTYALPLKFTPSSGNDEIKFSCQ